jgi:GR25 family glycosyltransferase involved in LPS biosynthesis
MKIDKVYIINLVNRTDRYESIKNMCNKLGPPFTENIRIDAVNGKSISNEEVYKLLTMNSILSLYHNSHLDTDIRSIGAVGCYLSHYNIWKDIILNNYKNVIILEDDTSTIENIKTIMEYIDSLPYDYDIGFMNYYNYNFKNSVLLNENKYWCSSKDYTFFFTDCYILSNNGAKVLIEKALPISDQVDAYIHTIATTNPKFKRYFTNKPLFKQNTNDFGTDIQNECFKCKLNRYVDFLTENEFSELVVSINKENKDIKENFEEILDHDDDNNNYNLHNCNLHNNNCNKYINKINNKIIETFISNKKKYKYNNNYYYIKIIIIIIILIYLFTNN